MDSSRVGSRGPGKAPSITPLKRIRVLILDQHPTVCRALEARLSKSSRIEVLATAQSLSKGLDLASGSATDVILVDSRLVIEPERRRIYADLSSSKGKHKAGVIVLSTYGDAAEREAILGAGADRFLVKDIDSQRLIAEIEAVAAENAT